MQIGESDRARPTNRKTGPTGNKDERASAFQVKLRELITDADVIGALDVLRGGLGATSRVWSSSAKVFQDIPDWRTRTGAAEKILAYSEGLPVQRQEIVQVLVQGIQEATEQAMSSPALQALARKLIERSASMEAQPLKLKSGRK